jgi:hypothetical protein
MTSGTPCRIGREYLNSMRRWRWPLINATSGVVRPISKERFRIKGATHSLNRTAELGQDTIAGRVSNPALV